MPTVSMPPRWEGKLKLVEEERMGSADCDLIGSVVVMITREKPYLPPFPQ